MEAIKNVVGNSLFICIDSEEFALEIMHLIKSYNIYITEILEYKKLGFKTFNNRTVARVEFKPIVIDEVEYPGKVNYGKIDTYVGNPFYITPVKTTVYEIMEAFDYFINKRSINYILTNLDKILDDETKKNDHGE